MNSDSQTLWEELYQVAKRHDEFYDNEELCNRWHQLALACGLLLARKLGLRRTVGRIGQETTPGEVDVRGKLAYIGNDEKPSLCITVRILFPYPALYKSEYYPFVSKLFIRLEPWGSPYALSYAELANKDRREEVISQLSDWLNGEFSVAWEKLNLQPIGNEMFLEERGYGA